jgi:hypothetical protein
MYSAGPANPVSDDVFLKFEYDERDIVNAMRVRLSGRLRLGMILVGLGAVGLGVAHALGPAWSWPASIAVLSTAVLYTLVDALRIAPPKMFGGAFEAQREAPGAPEGFRDATMSVDASEDGVTVTLGSRLANIRWADCVRLESSARTYVLLHGRKGFVVVPRRAFRTEKRDAAFRELVERHLGGRAGG